MAISPKIINGSPKKPGYYWMKISNDPIVWEMYEISVVGGEQLFAEPCASDLNRTFNDSEIKDQTWSERIAPPSGNF